MQQAATRRAQSTRVTSPVRSSGATLLACVAASVAVCLPCFWQSRIQAGDLSSHVYNAWLAGEIHLGRLPGLVVVRQWTNFLFDAILSALIRIAGYSLGQKLAVAASVLLFFWCAFAFVSVVAKRRPWHMMVPLAMLAYGWVFHMGFLNYYIAVALSLAALAACWRGPDRRSIWAVPLLTAAAMAHALPVAWAIGAILYVWTVRRFRNHAPFATFVVASVVIIATGFLLAWRFETRHSLQQAFASTGADQFAVFGAKYAAICAGVLLFWFALWRDLRKRFGYGRILSSPSFQLFAITAATVVILPTAVLLPQYEHGLMYIADRMSLIIGVLICAMLARAVSSTRQKVLIACVAVLFFVWIYRDTALANRTETKISSALSQLPQGARVLSSFQDTQSRVNPLAHAVDRACIGRCFSYGNYEPSTRQFRVRAVALNPYVVSRYVDADAIQSGTYRVQPQDIPAYQVAWCDGRNEICVQPLSAGVLNGTAKP